MDNNQEKKENHETNSFEGGPRNIRWIRIGQIKPEEFQPLLKRIIGPKRSMSEFARDCDVSVSSISRLINGQAKEPSCQMLLTLLDHADSESGVTAETLFDAAGFKPQKSSSDIIEERMAAERRIKMILITTLIEQGHTVKELVFEKESPRKSFLRPDIALETDAFDGIWNFEVIDYDSRYQSTASEMDEEMKIRRSAMMTRHAFLQILGRIYLEHSQNSAVKYTFVFKNKGVYDRLVDEFSEVIVYDNISFMLIDTDEGVIVSEHTLHKTTL